MDFRTQQEKLLEFLSTNYQSAGLTPTFTTDFLDFDRYKGDFTVFVDFARIGFRQSQFIDDCQDVEQLSLTIYLVRRNDMNETLKRDILDAAFSFYQMIKRDPHLGIAIVTAIDGIDFFNYVEGTKNIVCAEFTLSLEVDI